MVVDMGDAVAVVAVAPGAVTEFQLRGGDIGFAANGAAMGVSGMGFFLWLCAGEGHRAGLFWCGFLSETPLCLDLPGHWDEIACIFSEKQEIVGKGDQREKICGENANRCGQNYDLINDIDKIEQCQNPCFDRY